jgi:hypothetical protein
MRASKDDLDRMGGTLGSGQKEMPAGHYPVPAREAQVDFRTCFTIDS